MAAEPGCTHERPGCLVATLSSCSAIEAPLPFQGKENLIVKKDTVQLCIPKTSLHGFGKSDSCLAKLSKCTSSET